MKVLTLGHKVPPGPGDPDPPSPRTLILRSDLCIRIQGGGTPGLGDTVSPILLLIVGSLLTFLPPSLRTIGTSYSVPDKSMPLGCHLCNFHALRLKGEIRPKQLFYCNKDWPQHKLDNHSKWLENQNFNYNILRDLDKFCHHNGK